MEQFKKKNRWRQRDRHSRGSCPQYQAPAWWVGGTWVNTAPVWDVVFNKGVAPQQKMLISQHDCDGSKSLGWWGNLLWQCSGLWQHVTSLSHKSTLELLHSADGKKTRCVDSSHTFQPPLTVASPHLGEVAAAFAGLFAEFDDVPACCLGGDGHLSHSLFPIAEVHGQYHLRNKNSVMRAERITHVRVTKNMAKIKSFSPRSHQITFTRGYLIQNPNKKNKMNIKRHHLLTSVVTWRGWKQAPKSEVTLLAERFLLWWLELKGWWGGVQPCPPVLYGRTRF